MSEETALLLLTNLGTALITGATSWLTTRSKNTQIADLRKQTQSDTHEFKAREQIFEEYRKLVVSTKEVINDLQAEIDKILAESRQLQKDYVACMAKASGLEMLVQQLQKQLIEYNNVDGESPYEHLQRLANEAQAERQELNRKLTVIDNTVQDVHNRLSTLELVLNKIKI